MKRAGSGCRTPGCPGIVRGGVCSVCGPRRGVLDRGYDQQRGSSAERGYDGRWQRLRGMYLRQHPVCVECAGQGRTVVATEVHHKIPKRAGGTDHFDNLLALCKPCHSRITVSGG